MKLNIYLRLKKVIILLRKQMLTVDEKGNIIDDLVPCRHQNEFTFTTPDKVQLYGCFAETNCFCCCCIDSILRT